MKDRRVLDNVHETFSLASRTPCTTTITGSAL
jgi:hypothetical protein